MLTYVLESPEKIAESANFGVKPEALTAYTILKVNATKDPVNKACLTHSNFPICSPNIRNIISKIQILLQ